MCVCVCALLYLVLLQSVLRRLLFPALVDPAMTTWTPLRSRSPLLSSLRCRSISARRSHTDLSTAQRQRGEQDVTKVSCSTSLSRPCKRNFCPFEGKRHVLRCLTPFVWMKNGSWTRLFPQVTEAEKYFWQYNASTICHFLKLEIFNFLSFWLMHIHSCNLGWLEIKRKKTSDIT